MTTTVCTHASPRTAYDDWHDRLPVDRGADAPWHRLLGAHLDPDRDLAGKSVLEIGCGRGGFACRLAQYPRPPRLLVAADFSPTAVTRGRAHANRYGISQIEWEVADIEALGHRSAAFDTVISCETIEHVSNPTRAIGELARVLKSGGRLLMTTPNYFGPLGLYRLYLRLRGRSFTEEGQPINQFMILPRTRAWVLRAGLHVQTVDAVGHYLPFPGRPPVEVSCLDRWRPVTRWVGLHSLVVAVKS